MRLPFLQIAMEVLEQLAPEVAVELNHDEDAVLGKLVRFFKWALGRCPEDLPPSYSSTVIGQHAAKHIARAAMWLGDPDEFVDAICKSQFSILQRMPGGIRIRGLDRYDAAWKKNHQDEWKALSAASAPKPAPNSPETGAEPVPQMQTKTQTQTQSPSEMKEGPPPSVPLTYQCPTKPEAEWDGIDFFSWAQTVRVDSGLMAEKWPRQEKLRTWWTKVYDARVTVWRLQNAYFKYGESDFWAKKDPPHPFAGFMTQWEDFVPQEVAA